MCSQFANCSKFLEPNKSLAPKLYDWAIMDNHSTIPLD